MIFLALAVAVSPSSLLQKEKVNGIVAVVDVRNGELVAAAGNIDGERVLPLSLLKVVLAASALEHGVDGGVQEMLVASSDDAARALAVQLRKVASSQAVLTDVRRYGLRISLPEEASDAEWAETFSLGEKNVMVTALEMAKFFRLVGSDTARMLNDSTKLRLRQALLEVVQRGTAKEIRGRVVNGKIGGKTGSGPGPGTDGWFAGLIFGADGQPRFAFATYVRKGDPGGGTAARISADLANSLLSH
jgi:hypothetical protein